MNNLFSSFLIFYSLFSIFSLAQAQVVEDNSLSTQVETENNLDFAIDAGEQRGSNLFHSFSEFSIPTNGSVSFNNGLSIQNIITRVTGSSVSNIDGLIQANGAANLFLINPNGIIFGENARLNIGGSFIGTSAESLVFEDGAEFSTNLDNLEPLLTVNVPLGLQFGSNPGEITNKANFDVPNPFDPTGRDRVKLGLTVLPNKTLALLGGDLSFDGGAVASNGGNIELGSVAESLVVLEAFGEGFKANYDSVEQFQDIQLTNLASVNASGEGGGNINFRGRNIQILDGSAITSNTLGDIDGKTIQLEASNLVEINGSDRTGTKVDPLLANFEIFFPFASQIESSTLSGAGKAGDIKIVTHNLQFIDGGEINLLTFPDSTGEGGNLFIFATGSIELRGFRPLLGIGEDAAANIQQLNPSLSLDDAIDLNQPSAITNSSISQASSGDINIESMGLVLKDGASIGTSPFRTGDAGDVRITAAEYIEIIGVSPRKSTGSSIASNTFSQGNAGDIYLETGRLSILNGGIVVSSTSIVGGGNAGNIAIDTQLTEIDGVSPNGQKPSLLSSETNNESTGGSIFLNTESLVISDRGTITIKGRSTGSPGNLQVNANSVVLTNDGQITAENAAAFEGGNIELNIGDRLTLEENSLISAQAFGNANGGNIDIIGGFVVANPNENNDILATAVRGDGGNINIMGEGIFGIQKGTSKPPNFSNDIDASSEFGMDGTVSFNFPEARESNFETQKYFEILEQNNLLSNNLCKTSLGSKYYVTGKGGIAFSPDRDLNIQDSWTDFRFFDDEVAQNKIEDIPSPPKANKIQPIQGWFKDSQGRIVLTAKPLVATSDSSQLPRPDCNNKTDRRSIISN